MNTEAEPSRSYLCEVMTMAGRKKVIIPFGMMSSGLVMRKSWILKSVCADKPVNNRCMVKGKRYRYDIRGRLWNSDFVKSIKLLVTVNGFFSFDNEGFLVIFTEVCMITYDITFFFVLKVGDNYRVVFVFCFT